jgi:hypothetical protein
MGSAERARSFVERLLMSGSGAAASSNSALSFKSSIGSSSSFALFVPRFALVATASLAPLTAFALDLGPTADFCDSTFLIVADDPFGLATFALPLTPAVPFVASLAEGLAAGFAILGSVWPAGVNTQKKVSKQFPLLGVSFYPHF